MTHLIVNNMKDIEQQQQQGEATDGTQIPG